MKAQNSELTQLKFSHYLKPWKELELQCMLRLCILQKCAEAKCNFANMALSSATICFLVEAHLNCGLYLTYTTYGCNAENGPSTTLTMY